MVWAAYKINKKSPSENLKKLSSLCISRIDGVWEAEIGTTFSIVQMWEFVKDDLYLQVVFNCGNGTKL